VIEKATEEYFDSEIDIRHGKLITYPAMVRLTMKIAGKLFFGVQFDDKQLDAIMDVTKASMSPLHVEIPYTDLLERDESPAHAHGFLPRPHPGE